MKLTILGSGTTFPKADAGSAGYLLESGDTKILFDLGLGTLHKLDRLGIDVRKMRHIFLTHLHADHVCELAPLLFYLTVVKKTRMDDPVNQDISFTLYGPKGTREYVQKLWDITKVRDGDLDYVHIIELESETVIVDDLKITAAPMKHMVTTVGYRVLDKDGKVFVFTGDTSPCQSLINLAKDADVLLIECANPKTMWIEGHNNSVQCGTVASDAHVKRMVLTHQYPEALAVDVKAEAAAEFDGEIIVAKDLMQIDI